MPHLLDLPYDLLVDSLFPLLPVSALVAVAATSSYLNAALDAPALWSRLLKRDFRFPVASTARTTGFRLLYSRLTKPCVYVWGEDSNGRLGLDWQEKAKYRQGQGVPTPVKLDATGSGKSVVGWVDLKASGFGFHALDWEGTVWVWGTLDGGRWADSHESLHHPGKLVEKPTPLSAEGLPPLQSLAAGRTSGLGLDDSGLVYEWHAWGRILRLTNTPWEASRVCQISCGWDYNAVLDHQGHVWVWRNVEQSLPQLTANSSIQVEEFDISMLTVLCPELDNEKNENDKIVKIATGHGFLVVLTEMGKVLKLDVTEPPSRVQQDQSIQISRDALDTEFISHRRTWSSLDKFWNVEQVRTLEAFDQVEVNNSTFKRPTDDFKVTHISATFETFAVYRVTEHADESIVLIGTTSSEEPTVHAELQGRGVIDVCLGDYHMGAVLESGQLLTWGKYSHGALGLSTTKPMEEGEDSAQDNEPQFGQGLLRGGLRALPVFRPPMYHPMIRRGLALAPHEVNVDVPTAVPRFTGDQPRTRQQVAPSQRLDSGNDVCEEEGEFVYTASFAGWHSGCLAVAVRPS